MEPTTAAPGYDLTTAAGSLVETPSSLIYATHRSTTWLPDAAKGNDADTHPLRYLQFTGLSVPLVEPYANRDRQPLLSRTVPGGLRYRSPFLRIGHHMCRARRGTMRATKALRQTQIAISLGRPKSKPLSMIADFTSDPTIILRVGLRSVIRSNMNLGRSRGYDLTPLHLVIRSINGRSLRPGGPTYISGAEARASD